MGTVTNDIRNVQHTCERGAEAFDEIAGEVTLGELATSEGARRYHSLRGIAVGLRLAAGEIEDILDERG